MHVDAETIFNIILIAFFVALAFGWYQPWR